MREAKSFTFAEAFTKCITTWLLNDTAIIKTAEDSPPSVGETFRLGFKDYTVVSVCGPYSYEYCYAVIVPKEAAPCV
ncbi:hypothetical protein K3169_13925 [Pseudomonas phytophila]|uniref:Uncharacterized protein n=1 Tax=Pseudomonas phytophila TaxID=2867264 RepID=A0ABY6FLR8_9PSED|nr:hypothetical protein [Pseudomonas phytophila]UXZ98882.1 hypothetical protein K3169_13925 [Pseudomonas phytophila]